MTDYYVDHTAAGAGDGSTPADAFTTILSRSIAWADGDRVWVRRTHVESQSGAVRPIGGAVGYQNRMFIIGWPDTNYPFHSSRPAAGVSAGWDADNSALATFTTYSLNVPTLSSSGGSTPFSILVGTGTVVKNMCFNQLGTTQLVAAGFFTSYTLGDNIMFLQGLAPNGQGLSLAGHWGEFGKVTLVASAGSNLLHADCIIKHLVVHPACIAGVGLLSIFQGRQFNINFIEQLSNSVPYLVNTYAPTFWPAVGINASGNMPAFVNQIVGVKPFSGTNWNGSGDTAGVGNIACRVNDYYGEGPVMFGHGGIRSRMATSAEAMFDGNRVMVIEKRGINVNNASRNTFMPIISKVFSVVSGTQINIAVPMYVDSSAVASLSNEMLLMTFNARNCGEIGVGSKHLQAGSATPWTGTLPVGGTPYIAVNCWNPTNTGLAQLEVIAPCYTRSLATNAAGSAFYVLYGEPYEF